MKKKIFSLLLVALMVVSMLSILCNVKAEPTTDSPVNVGKVHVDVSAILHNLGYSDDANVSEKLLVQILRSYNTTAVRHSDGDYYITIDSTTPKASLNLIGTDKVSSVDFNVSSMPKPSANSTSSIINDASANTINNPSALLAQRACLVFGIWDYAPSSGDPTDIQNAYNSVTSAIVSTSAYDYWHFLTNADCTFSNVANWITWACYYYQNVDVYWIGHGTQETIGTGSIVSAYCTYDYWDSNGNIDASKLYIPQDFTTGTYDYSPLRAGFGCFCFGDGFADTFRSPGGLVTHDRFLSGPSREVAIAYANAYVDKWSHRWYLDYQCSKTASTDAYNYALPNLATGTTVITYHGPSGNGIWFR